MKPESRFATKEEILSPEFSAINDALIFLNREYRLSDHTEINAARFPWSAGRYPAPSVYVSRLWEYPFAVLASGPLQGLKCADVGCGTSPFTLYLSQLAGPGCVTGFDPDVIDGEGKHSMFGANRKLLAQAGVGFRQCDMSALQADDESFDRVYCISVLEHVEEPSVWQKGIREMVRILKPGGLLILTMDLGIETPLANVFDVVKYSGLVPAGCLQYSWPEQRFLQQGDKAMDVYGLVLSKSDKPIFLDYGEKHRAAEYTANRTFVPGITSSQQLQVGKDLARKFGVLRVILKSLAGKYSANR